jgi:hypothetical protein
MTASVLFASRMIAKLSATLFAANSLFINTIQHPARMSQSTTFAVTDFRLTFKRIAAQQSTLSLVGLVSGMISYYYQPSYQLLIPAIMMGAMIPYTLLLIFPINSELMNLKLEKEALRANYLLHRWLKLHTIRTFVSVVAAFMLNYYF